MSEEVRVTNESLFQVDTFKPGQPIGYIISPISRESTFVVFCNSEEEAAEAIQECVKRGYTRINKYPLLEKHQYTVIHSLESLKEF